MGNCCHGSSGSKTTSKYSRSTWWGLGGFALILGLLWGFDGNPLVSRIAPAVILGLILLWLTVAAVRKMGLHPWHK